MYLLTFTYLILASLTHYDVNNMDWADDDAKCKVTGN